MGMRNKLVVRISLLIQVFMHCWLCIHYFFCIHLLINLMRLNISKALRSYWLFWTLLKFSYLSISQMLVCLIMYMRNLSNNNRMMNTWRSILMIRNINIYTSIMRISWLIYNIKWLSKKFWPVSSKLLMLLFI